MLKVLDDAGVEEEPPEEPTLDTLARAGARRMLMKALAVEVAQYVDEHADERDAQGHRLVVRNGRAQARTVTCGAGTLGGPGAAGQRSTGGRGRAAAIHESDPPALHAAVPQGRRSAADPLSARAVHG